jgi:nucleoside 2-deoxyribosyltransferase
MTNVFLSHAHRDAELASAVRQALAQSDLEVFTPWRDIAAGSNWRAAIKAAIEAADAMVIVIGSPEAAASSWITYEAAMAEARGKPIILLVSQDVTASELPVELADHRVVAFDPENPAQAARAAREGLRALA